MTVFFDRTLTDQWKAAQSAAATLRLRLAGMDLGEPPFDDDKALSQAAHDYRGTVFVLPLGLLLRDRERLADFAPRNRVVSMFWSREPVDAGG